MILTKEEKQTLNYYGLALNKIKNVIKPEGIGFISLKEGLTEEIDKKTNKF